MKKATQWISTFCLSISDKHFLFGLFGIPLRGCTPESAIATRLTAATWLVPRTMLFLQPVGRDRSQFILLNPCTATSEHVLLGEMARGSGIYVVDRGEVSRWRGCVG